MVFQPVASARVVDLVRDSLRQAILTGDLTPGTRLSVPELARQLQVSRSPVREAVLLLVGEGLAVEHSRRGVEVAQLSLADLLELYELRAATDSLAAALAAERMTTTDLAALRGVMDAQGQLPCATRGSSGPWTAAFIRSSCRPAVMPALFVTRNCFRVRCAWRTTGGWTPRPT
ncbi:GntR family transcriptional regulator [Deinococcus malanensis]|uniref:GntR family transcriptional regulator n=1 Tax=Deinococcus malanensis TaxID=1706855 RepID=UPI003636A6D1